MDFDQMLDVWRAQNTAPPYEANREALRQSLQAEAARVGRNERFRRRVLWVVGLMGAGMAVWAAFWIAITITNGWPTVYAITSGASVCIFAFGARAIWVSRGRQAEPERNEGNTLQEEVRRILAHVDLRLSLTRQLAGSVLGVACLVAGMALFSWTLTSSQDIPGQPVFGGWSSFTFLWAAFCVWRAVRALADARKARPALELRQRHLQELLASLDARE